MKTDRWRRNLLRVFSCMKANNCDAGELDLTEVFVPAPGPAYPFHILDVREPDLFARSHLALAQSYPAIR